MMMMMIYYIYWLHDLFVTTFHVTKSSTTRTFFAIFFILYLYFYVCPPGDGQPIRQAAHLYHYIAQSFLLRLICLMALPVSSCMWRDIRIPA